MNIERKYFSEDSTDWYLQQHWANSAYQSFEMMTKKTLRKMCDHIADVLQIIRILRSANSGTVQTGVKTANFCDHDKKIHQLETTDVDIKIRILKK